MNINLDGVFESVADVQVDVRQAVEGVRSEMKQAARDIQDMTVADAYRDRLTALIARRSALVDELSRLDWEILESMQAPTPSRWGLFWYMRAWKRICRIHGQ